MEEFLKVYQSSADYIQEGVYIVDKNRTIRYWNKSAERIAGFSESSVLGRRCYENILNHIDDKGNQLCKNGCPLHDTLKDGKIRKTKLFLHHVNGERIPINITVIPIIVNDRIEGAIEFFNESINLLNIKKKMEELEKRAMLDDLTKIPNRRYFNDCLMKFLNNRDMEIFGVVFFDIDSFKTINDSYGHDVGDEVIKMVAQTLLVNLRKSDVPSRWGGDEFAALIPGVGLNGLSSVGEKIRFLVENSGARLKNGTAVKTTISLGGSAFKPGGDFDDVFKTVDERMYKSKQRGKNTITIE